MISAFSNRNLIGKLDKNPFTWDLRRKSLIQERSKRVDILNMDIFFKFAVKGRRRRSRGETKEILLKEDFRNKEELKYTSKRRIIRPYQMSKYMINF